MLLKIKHKIFDLYATYKATNTYPDDIKIDVSTLVSKQRKVKIAIIDDLGFPWKQALELNNFDVSIYEDYIKDKAKSKPISLGKYDIIICDIHGIAKEIFETTEGIGVMKKLRDQFPFKILIAYTGDTGLAIKSGIQDQVDKIFSKDWKEDDFILNIKSAEEILFNPGKRWKFLHSRLSNINATEEQIEKIKRQFVRTILLINMHKQRNELHETEIAELIKQSESKIDSAKILKTTTSTISITGTFLPLIIG